MSCMSNAYYELICCGHAKRHQTNPCVISSRDLVLGRWTKQQKSHHGNTGMKQTPTTKGCHTQNSGKHTGHQAGVPQERLATPSCQGNAIPDTSSQMWVKEYVMCFAITWFQLWIVQSGHHSAVEATKRHQLVRLV